MPKKLEWDADGSRFYEKGVNHGVLYPWDPTANNNKGDYGTGVAWNGLTGVTESPDGAEPTDLWADNIKYASMRSAETFGGTIEAYTFPDEFYECDGSVSPVAGMQMGQQARKSFGLCYRTEVGNDQNDSLGYKLHLIYGCKASPSEKAYETVNDSPDAITMSWEFDSTPAKVTIAGFNNLKPVSSVTIDSTEFTDNDAKARLAALENVLYGSTEADARLPMPEEVYQILSGTNQQSGGSEQTGGTTNP